MPRVEVKQLDQECIEWFVDVAIYNMVCDELKRPELFNREALSKIASKALLDGTAFVAYAGDEPVGAIGGILCPHLLNPDISVLIELMWYVLPEYRKSRAGALLLGAFHNKGEKCADEMTLSLLNSSDINIATLEKRGLILEEFGFRKSFKGLKWQL